MTRFMRDDSPEDRENDPPVFAISGNPFSSDFRITYDDHLLKGVKSLTLQMDARSLPEITLVLEPGSIEIETATALALTAHVTADQYEYIKDQHPTDPPLPMGESPESKLDKRITVLEEVIDMLKRSGTSLSAIHGTKAWKELQELIYERDEMPF